MLSKWHGEQIPKILGWKRQIPLDLVVKCQGNDHAEVIFQLIW
jgi:hypothetical protein